MTASWAWTSPGSGSATGNGGHQRGSVDLGAQPGGAPRRPPAPPGATTARRWRRTRLDRVDDAARRQPAERAGQLDRFGEAEAVRRHAERRSRQRARRRRRSGGPCRLPRPTRRRRPGRRASAPSSRAEQRASPRRRPRRPRRRRAACPRAARATGRPGRVVAAVGIADADDDRCAALRAMPQPRSISSSQEMRRAGDAGVVVADRLLAAVAQRVVGQVEPAVDEARQVVLDARLVLRGRRHDLGVGDRAVGVEPVAVIEQAARRLGRAVAGAGARLDRRRTGRSGCS